MIFYPEWQEHRALARSPETIRLAAVSQMEHGAMETVPPFEKSREMRSRKFATAAPPG